MTLVEILRQSLENAELSQAEAARRSGAAKVTVEKWMAGRVPRADALVRFLRACGVKEKILEKWNVPEPDEDA